MFYVSCVCTQSFHGSSDERWDFAKTATPTQKYNPYRAAGFGEVKHAHDIRKPYLNSGSSLLESSLAM